MPRPPKEPSALRSIVTGAKRSSNLERRYLPGSEGIQFNSGTYGTLNIGDYLQVAAKGPGVGLAWGAAIEIVATAASAADGGVYIADGGTVGVTLRETGTGGLFLVAEAPSFGIELQNNSTSTPVLIEQFAGSGTAGITLETLNSSGKQIALLEHTGGGIGLIADGGGSINVSTHSNVLSFPGTATRPIILVAEPSAASQPTINFGVSGTDFVCVFDNNSFGSPIERVKFLADGHVEMLSLPTSSAGLPSGSLWNSAGTVKIV